MLPVFSTKIYYRPSPHDHSEVILKPRAKFGPDPLKTVTEKLTDSLLYNTRWLRVNWQLGGRTFRYCEVISFQNFAKHLPEVQPIQSGLNGLRERTKSVSPVYSSDECTGICAARHVEREWSFKNLVQSLQRKQEAQLSPSDRAMRLVSSNLANYHATVQKLLIRQVLTKPMV